MTQKLPLLPEKFTTALKLRLQQTIAITIILTAIIYTITLATFNLTDPAFNFTASTQIKNWLGPIGAKISDISLHLTGITAYSLSIILTCYGAIYFHYKEIRNPKKRIITLIPTIITLALTTTAITQFLNIEQNFPTPAGIGGIIGAIATPQTMSNLANWIGQNLTIIPQNITITIIEILTNIYFHITLTAIITTIAISLFIYQCSLKLHEYIAIAKFISRNIKILCRIIIITILFIPLWIFRNKGEKFTAPDILSESPEEKPSPKKPAVDVTPQAKKTPAKTKTKKQYNLLQKDEAKIGSLPPVTLLSDAKTDAIPNQSQEALQQNAKMLESVLQDFGVKGEITQVRPGPVVTLYELQPAPGTKTSRVVALSDDIARSMSALSVRIATIPGRNVIGIELPNETRCGVLLRELLESEKFQDGNAKLPLILGKDIGGTAEIADLSSMPHLLIAGTTGSGKSVGLNAMILSLLYRYRADECRFIMVDPKMLELSVYDDIPHLLTPVVTEPKKALVALKWAVKEMEERYRAMSYLSVRNIDGYNKRIREAAEAGEDLTRKVQVGFDNEQGEPIYESHALALEVFPYIVVVVDEMADLMLVAGKEIEASIQRLAQMARAAGIHLIMATQRPSVDVITGTIKANFPTRISFMVTSKIDSRTILGEQGAEQLLGKGDMLFMEGGGRIKRVHGPFVDDSEVASVCNFLRSLGSPSYIEDVTRDDDEEGGDVMGGDDSADELYESAVEVVMREGKASTSFIQRHLQIGYNRAARIMDMMEKRGVVSAANHAGKREIL